MTDFGGGAGTTVDNLNANPDLDGVVVGVALDADADLAASVLDVAVTDFDAGLGDNSDFIAFVLPTPFAHAAALLVDSDLEASVDSGGVICPPVLSIVAVALTPTSVQVNFSEPVILNGELIEAENYMITGPNTVTVLSVAPGPGLTPTFVVLTTTEHRQGATYTLLVERTQSLTEGALTDDYTGLGDPPQVATVTAINSRLVEVCFDEAMAPGSGLLVPGNYVFAGDSAVLGVAVTLNHPTRPTCALVQLDNDLVTGVANYTVTVPAGFTDLAGNGLAAPYMIPFDGISPEAIGVLNGYVPEDGGWRIVLTGLPDGYYEVHLGPLGSLDDPLCYPGEFLPGHAALSSLGRCEVFSPVLGVGGPYPFTIQRVSNVGGALSGFTTTVTSPLITVLPASFRSETYALRRRLPLHWAVGNLSIEDEPS